MKRGGPGLLVFLIAALLVAFLLMKQMQSPTPFGDKAAEKAGDNAVQAAESAVTCSTRPCGTAVCVRMRTIIRKCHR